MKQFFTRPVVLGGLILVMLAGLTFVMIGLRGASARLPEILQESGLFSGSPPTATPVLVRPALNVTPEGAWVIQASLTATETLNTLNEIIVPESDLRQLAQQLGEGQEIPATTAPPAAPFRVGDRQEFWVNNSDTKEYFLISAVCAAVSDHAYIWLHDEVRYQEKDVQQLSEVFETKIYPTDRAFFGSEWTPGVDGDPHLYILFVRGIGANLLGAFSTIDEYHPLTRKYSNAHEMFVLNANKLALNSPATYGTLAHEFQHMIHWYRDRNEETWLNEGASELAAYLNGYDRSRADILYTQAPDIQLNDWPDYSSRNVAHYRAALLFLAYFLDRFGEQATQALVAHSANGMESLDQVLAGMNSPSAETDPPLGADDIFQDWTIANYLQDDELAGGRYGYRAYPLDSRPKATETVRKCPVDPVTRDVHQYGVDYIEINCRGDYSLTFEGSVQVKLLPEDSHSGDFAFWSNQDDESDMRLTQTFDFSDLSGPLSLSYWTWFDLENDYDYVYVEASLDGKAWQILTTPAGTGENPTGNSYGWGYTGKSAGWIQERVDLSGYAGKKVSLRFQYITDTAVHGDGFLLDDVAIPEIGYHADFETGAGGWAAAGWVRLNNVLPQTYRLALITIAGESITVEMIALNGANSVSLPLHLDKEVDQAILVVSGTTRYTRQKAAYRYAVQSP